MEEESMPCSFDTPNDWMEHVDQLPDRPKSLLEERFKLLFALDVQGKKMHDMYVALLPNQVCMVGLAPSHPLIRRHRRPDLMEAEVATCSDEPCTSASAQAPALAVASDAAKEAPPEVAPPAPDASQLVETAVQQQPHPQLGDGLTSVGSHPPYQAGWKRRRGGKGEQEDVNDDPLAGGLRVDSFPLAALKAINFDVDARQGRSRIDIKDSGRSGKKQNGNSGTVLRSNSCLCRVESNLGEW